ncbi:MAG: glycerol-3-phosphate acyltransferase [Actinomycetota bacterium]|nr:glycerol-3-phosphate acyltransferase [Actinomycetota bacterium]
MRTVAVVAGLSVAGAYLLGSVPLGYLLLRGRLRRDLGRADLRTMLTGGGATGRADDAVAAVLDTAKVLLAATLAWHLVEDASPGFDRGVLPALSAVGFLADQVLTAWQSVGLWAGTAAVVGHLAPPWLGFRRAHGEAPALGLVFVYCPAGFAAGVAAFFAALAVTRRPVPSALAGLTAFVGWAWTAWVFDWRTGWGVTNGPELALWATVLAGVLAAHTLSGHARPLRST